MTDATGAGPLAARPAGKRLRLIRWHSPPIEWAFIVVLLACLTAAWFRFRYTGYLPLPFWPDPQDVYADGYSTAWWAFNGRMYDIWKTVYPPASFAISRWLADARCYDADVTYVRDCDWQLWSWLLAFYLLNAFIAFRAFSIAERHTAWPRTMALMLGLPMLYSFEHLNLLVIAYTGLFLAFSPGIRSSRLKWLGLATAINLKIYLLAVLVGQLVKRRWRWVEGVLFATIAVYIVSYAIVGHGSPLEIYRNIVIFASDPERASSWYFVFYASSYKSMVEFFDSQFQVMSFIGSWRVEFWSVTFRVAIGCIQAATLAALTAIWIKPEAVSRVRVAALCYLIVLISNETGGYTAAGAVFLVFLEPWRSPGRITAIVAAYMLCIALDIGIQPIANPKVVQGYFAGRPVWQRLYISAGPFVRPGLIMTMQCGLLAATWSDLRASVSSRRRDMVASGPNAPLPA